MIFTIQVGTNTLAYVLKIYTGEYLAGREIPVSPDHCVIVMCYFAIDLIGTYGFNITVSLASVSDGRSGPFSRPVKSVDKGMLEHMIPLFP